MDSENPQIEVVVEKQLASRSDRFAATLLDGLIMIVIIFIPLLFIYGLEGFTKLQPEYGFRYNVAMFFIGQFVYILLQGNLLYKHGQTIGKKYMEIKITDLNNNLPSIQSSYGRRFLFISIISLVPVFGVIVAFIDPLLIFRKDRRCLHDLFADTKVVEA